MDFVPCFEIKLATFIKLKNYEFFRICLQNQYLCSGLYARCSLNL